MKNPEIKTRPWCPFCGQDVAKPLPPTERKPMEFNNGHCRCGALYVSDPTGFNIGSALVDCLVAACADNWELAWDLLPEDDYLTARVEDYDEQTHQVVATGNLDGRKIKGVLYFVRLHKDIAEIARKDKGALVPPRVSSSRSLPIALEPLRDPKRKKQRATKQQVAQLVEMEDVDRLVDLAFDDQRTYSFLQRLLYAPSEEKRWQVAHLIGLVYGRLSTRKPGAVSDILHRLFASCTDSASTHWGAIETIGEIIAARPDIYGAFVRHLLPFTQDEEMRPQALWALGAIAVCRPDVIRAIPFYGLFSLLDSPQPLIQGLAIRLFGRIRASEVEGRIKDMFEDSTPVVIYEQGKPVETSIGALAVEALKLIKKLETAAG